MRIVLIGQKICMCDRWIADLISDASFSMSDFNDPSFFFVKNYKSSAVMGCLFTVRKLPNYHEGIPSLHFCLFANIALDLTFISHHHFPSSFHFPIFVFRLGSRLKLCLKLNVQIAVWRAPIDALLHLLFRPS